MLFGEKLRIDVKNLGPIPILHSHHTHKADEYPSRVIIELTTVRSELTLRIPANVQHYVVMMHDNINIKDTISSLKVPIDASPTHGLFIYLILLCHNEKQVEKPETWKFISIALSITRRIAEFANSKQPVVAIELPRDSPYWDDTRVITLQHQYFMFFTTKKVNLGLEFHMDDSKPPTQPSWTE